MSHLQHQQANIKRKYTKHAVTLPDGRVLKDGMGCEEGGPDCFECNIFDCTFQLGDVYRKSRAKKERLNGSTSTEDNQSGRI